MAAKKQIPLRLSEKLYADIAAWAEDDFRSVNGQIEYLLSAAEEGWKICIGRDRCSAGIRYFLKMQPICRENLCIGSGCFDRKYIMLCKPGG